MLRCAQSEERHNGRGDVIAYRAATPPLALNATNAPNELPPSQPNPPCTCDIARPAPLKGALHLSLRAAPSTRERALPHAPPKYGSNLPPRKHCRAATPPLTLYANGSGGLLERMATTGVDCIGLDWTIDMEDGRRRVGDKAVQGNVDPAVLFAPPEAIEKAVKDVVAKAGPTGHILNLGHGVLVGTPEESVKLFFDTARKCTY